MKRICKIIAVAVFLLLSTVSVLADDNLEYSVFYDFENYSGTGVLPGVMWGYRPENITLRNFGAEKDAERGGTVLRVGDASSANRPTLYFGQTFTTGKVHITYYARNNAEGSAGSGPMLYDERWTFDLKNATTSNYTWPANDTFLRPLVFSDIIGYRTGLQTWDSPTTVYTNDTNWHRIDILTDDLSEALPGIYMYYDGKPINPTPLTNTNFTGLTAIGFANELNTVWYDDIQVKRFYGDNGFIAEINGTSQVAAEDGVLKIKLWDEVDPEMLIEENVIITNTNTKEVITNFEIEDAEEKGFTVRFDGEIERGMYSLALSPNVRTKILSLPMLKEVTFRTEYEEREVNRVFLEESFDAYESTDGTLPQGWLYYDNEENYYDFKSVPDNAAGHALGIENSSTNIKNQVKAVLPYELEIPANLEFDISFDVYNENMQWYLYSYNKQSFDNGKLNEDSMLIAQTNTGGNIYYSKDGTTPARIKDLKAEYGAWHKITLKVVPQVANKTIYKISVDGGTPYEVTVTKDFYSKTQTGIGIGYIPRSDENKFYIDNINVSAKGVKARVPEIESLSCIDAADNAINLFEASNTLTSQLQRIDITMNTAVKSDSIKDNIRFTQNSAPVDYMYEVASVNGNSVISIYFDKLLEPSATYEISVNSLQSAFSDELKLKMGIKKSFTTLDDASIKIVKNSLDDKNYTYNLTIAKNNNAEVKYTVMAAGYKNQTINGTAVEKLEQVQYIPVILTTSERGIIYCDFDLQAFKGYDSIKTYLWRYPSNEIIDKAAVQID